MAYMRKLEDVVYELLKDRNLNTSATPCVGDMGYGGKSSILEIDM